MAGQHIARLRAAATGMNRHHVDRSLLAWRAGGETLKDLEVTLSDSSERLGKAFGDSGVRREAQLVLATVHQGVQKDRENMGKAAAALIDVAEAITDTQNENGQMPASSPGAAPTMEGGPYTDDADEIHAMKVHAAKVRIYNQQVAAYDAADERARVQVARLDATYDRAAEVFAGMYDDPAPRNESGTTATSTGTGGGTSPTGTTRPSYTDPHHHPVTVTTTPTTDDPTGTGHHDPTQTGSGDPTGPGAPGDPTQTGPGAGPGDLPGDGTLTPGGPFETVTPGSSGLLGSPVTPGVGAAGLGVLGGLGLRNLLTGAPTAVSVPGQPVTRSIGSTTRSGSGSVLGRSASGQRGGLAPGQQTSRSAAGRGAGRTAGSASGRRRKGEDDRDVEKEIYDVERDWTDDEGQFPGVIS